MTKSKQAAVSARKAVARTAEAGALGADLMLAPLIVMMRLPLMAGEASRQTSGRETTRAVAEKASAFAEGAAAAHMSLFNAAMSFWPDVMSGRTPALCSGAAVERSLDAALKPMRQTLRANFRRLSK